MQIKHVVCGEVAEMPTTRFFAVEVRTGATLASVTEEEAPDADFSFWLCLHFASTLTEVRDSEAMIWRQEDDNKPEYIAWIAGDQHVWISEEYTPDEEVTNGSTPNGARTQSRG